MPGRQEQRRKHDTLRDVLQSAFDIPLQFEDFLSNFDVADGPLQSVMPLQLARLQPGDRLSVVSCGYTLSPEPKTADLRDRFVLAADSVSFDLIKALATSA